MWLTTMLFVFVFSSWVRAAGITVLAPVNGGNVSSKDIILIGKASENVKEIEVKGVGNDSLKLKVDKGGFFSKIKLIGNSNNITLLADDGSKAELKISVDANNSFKYHPDDKEVANCSAVCHSGIATNGYSVKPTATACYECHDPNNNKAFVHGPVNMGVCEVCHAPHGSPNPNFLIVNVKTLCDGCHSALTSKHPPVSKKSCVDCHDPHSSDKEFQIK